MSNKILIALQYWEGDKAQASALIQYLADLEPRHSDLADVLLVNRHDCVTIPGSVALQVSRKFNLWQYSAPRGNTGWPAGCNSLWTNTIRWVESMSAARRIPRYKAIFTCESDGCPVFPDWILRMSQAWDLANRPKPVCVAGPVVYAPAEHMNGNLLVNGEATMLKWVLRTVDGLKANVGWDYALSPQFKKRGWANIPGIVSWYATRGYTLEKFHEAQRGQLIWIHGVKDLSLIELGRRHLLGEKI